MCVEHKGTPSELKHDGCHQPNCQYSFYDVSQVCKQYSRLPYCKRVLLECAVRKSFTIKDPRVNKVWKSTVDQLLLQCCKSKTITNAPDNQSEQNKASQSSDWNCDMGIGSIMFHPGRVVLQDFTGVAALVDLAALRDAVDTKIDDLSQVDSQCPADLVVDNFVQVRGGKTSMSGSVKTHA